MSLITDIEKLRGLEQQAKDAPDWPSPVEEAVYTYELIRLAPAMLSVLECFQRGDAETLQTLLDYLESNIGAGDPEYDAFEASCIKRLQKAASLMEQ